VEDTTIYNSATQHEKTLEAAIKLAAKKGIPVFPCKLNKTPFTRHGFKDATTDPKEISQMWERYRDVPCIGVPTGEASDLLVIDVDVDDGKQGGKSLAHLEETYEPLPTRRKVRTGGGGIQYLFRYTQGYGRIGNLTNLLPGIDVRGEGGYIILPPSVSHKGPYTWEEKGKRGYAPEWLIDLILTPPSKNGRGGGTDSFLGDDGTVVIPDGARDDTLFRLTCSLIRKGFPLPAIIAAIEETDRQCSESPGGDSRDDRSAREIVLKAYARYERGKLWIPSKGTEELLPFPIDAMPVKTQAFIREAARSLDCPPDLVGVPVLAALSASIGNSRWGKIKEDYYTSAALYLASVSAPGSSKTPSMNKAFGPVYDRQVELGRGYAERKSAYDREWKRYEALSKREKAELDAPVKLPYPRTWIDDTTLEALASRLKDNPNGLLLKQDELTGWIGGLNQYKGGKGNDKQKFIELWNNAPLSVDRKTSDEPELVPRPFVTIYGGIQPKMLHVLADGEGDGFFDRFLVAYPKGKVARPTDHVISPEANRSYRELVRGLYCLDRVEGGKPFEVPFTAEAKTAFYKYANELADEQEYGNLSEGLSNTLPKLKAGVARIALILALCRMEETTYTTDTTDTSSAVFSKRGQVWAEDVERAWTLVEYFKSSLYRVYRHTHSTNSSSLVASELIKYLSSNRPGEWVSKSAVEWGEVLPSAPTMLMLSPPSSRRSRRNWRS
jgi:hypothetical protein